MQGRFSRFQPVYEKHGIPTFPIVVSYDKAKKKYNKAPAVRGWQQTTIRASRAFTHSKGLAALDAFAYNTRPAGVTIVDIDDNDQYTLAHCLARFGPTPIWIKSPHGYHLPYRHNGEPRLTKNLLDTDLPVDILGDGMALAAGSDAGYGTYEFMRGSLDDWHDLPIMHNMPGILAEPHKPAQARPNDDARNNSLFIHAMRMARRVRSYDALLAECMPFVNRMADPLDDAEVQKTVASAWGYEVRGMNYVSIGTTIEQQLAAESMQACALYGVLRSIWGHVDGAFPIANAMAGQSLAISRKGLAKARRHLIDKGIIRQVQKAKSLPSNQPALFVWNR